MSNGLSDLAARDLNPRVLFFYRRFLAYETLAEIE